MLSITYHTNLVWDFKNIKKYKNNVITIYKMW